MATNLPDAMRMREIKYGAKTTPKLQSTTARLLLEGGRLAEALSLMLLADDKAGIAELRERALTEGRLVLLNMLRRRHHEISAADWNRAGAAAEAAGRPREAYRCYLEARNDAALEALKKSLPDYEIFIPQGK